MSLKNFFLKNSFTYKIYIYYNLYIRNKAYKNRKSYSQWGEDLFIQEFFKGRAKGFYVDIGSFHPIMYSNTFLLFKNELMFCIFQYKYIFLLLLRYDLPDQHPFEIIPN